MMNDRSWLTRDMAGSAVPTLGLAIPAQAVIVPVFHLLAMVGLYDT